MLQQVRDLVLKLPLSLMMLSLMLSYGTAQVYQLLEDFQIALVILLILVRLLLLVLYFVNLVLS